MYNIYTHNHCFTGIMCMIIATPLGAKAMEIAEKVATDSAEELKKASAEYDGSLPGMCG